MVPLPSLSKVFSLVVQEERQRTVDNNLVTPISVSPSEQPYSMNAATSNFGRGRLLCSHYGRTNHTVDKCYSLHGFPPGLGRVRGKPSYKDFSKEFSTTKAINYVDDLVPEGNEKMSPTPLPQSTAMLSPEQFQQLISLLQSQLAATSSSPIPTSAAPNTTPSNPLQTPFTGTTLFPPFVSITSSSSSLWLLDTGATHHVCCDINCFTDISPVNDAFVNLPNGAKASVTHMGPIQLTHDITLQYVLCVPTFSFNL